MGTKFNYDNSNLYTPVIFREDFNDNATLNLSQTWSLFWTAGQEENALDSKPELAEFYTNILIATVVAGILASVSFTFL